MAVTFYLLSAYFLWDISVPWSALLWITGVLLQQRILVAVNAHGWILSMDEYSRQGRLQGSGSFCLQFSSSVMHLKDSFWGFLLLNIVFLNRNRSNRILKHLLKKKYNMHFKCNNFSLVEDEHFILSPCDLTEFIRDCRFISIRLLDCTVTQKHRHFRSPGCYLEFW